MQILLIRHAESEGNAAKILQGQQEHPLSQAGHRQAALLGAFLATRWQPTHIYSSPLKRAIQTVQHCSVNTPICHHPDLMEIHNGILQGLTWQEAQERYPQLCQQLSQSQTWIPIPNAESPTLVFQRAHQFVQFIMAQHHDSDRLWVFSHGGILQHLIAQLMGCDRVWGLHIPPTALFEFEVTLEAWQTQETGQNQNNDRFTGHLFRVVQFNQTPHLNQS